MVTAGPSVTAGESWTVLYLRRLLDQRLLVVTVRQEVVVMSGRNLSL